MGIERAQFSLVLRSQLTVPPRPHEIPGEEALDGILEASERRMVMRAISLMTAKVFGVNLAQLQTRDGRAANDPASPSFRASSGRISAVVSIRRAVPQTAAARVELIRFFEMTDPKLRYLLERSYPNKLSRPEWRALHAKAEALIFS